MIIRVQHNLFDMPLSAVAVFAVLFLILWIAQDLQKKRNEAVK